MFPKEKIRQKINDIEQDIHARYQEIVQPGIFSGASGALVFYYYLNRLSGDQDHLNKFYSILEDIYERLNNDEYPNTYCDGLTGIAFTLNYFLEKEMIEPDAVEEALMIIDQLIIETAEIEASNVEAFDFLHGQFGAIYYLLERLKFTKDNEATTIRLFESAAQALKEDIEREVTNDGEVPGGNCGLAHGNIAYISILTKFLEVYPDNTIVRTSLAKLVSHQLSFLSPDTENTFSLFPGIVKQRSEIHYNIIAGWCYGDPPVLINLHKAAEVLNDSGLKRLCVQLSEHTAARDTVIKAASTELTDAGLCHGMSSIALNNKLLFELTGNSKFYENYLHFTDCVLERGNSPETKSGFRRYMGDNRHEDILYLLDGTMGIGLFLITTLLEEPTDWERFFLLK